MNRLLLIAAALLALATPSHAIYTECTVKKDTDTLNRSQTRVPHDDANFGIGTLGPSLRWPCWARKRPGVACRPIERSAQDAASALNFNATPLMQ
jgi:hypothetical protein